MKRLPIVALLAIFVVAALLAVTGHLLPGGLREVAGRLGRNRGDTPGKS